MCSFRLFEENLTMENAMRLRSTKISVAIQFALATAGTLGNGTAVLAQSTGVATDAKTQSLETIVVTGSNIRRVDIETANPVVTIDRAQIQQSGKVNLADLIQELPSMAGAPITTSTNNGGTGFAGVSLRGLGSSRTLLLINGHRVPFQLQNVNIIPLNIVERVEVLNDGASAIYGSDAIAGVVNIITRSSYQGAELGLSWGESDHDDGARRAVNLEFGQTTEKGSIIFGLQYDKQDAVAAANRDYSKNAQYNYTNHINTHGGSSRTPSGSFFVPDDSPIAKQLGCTKLTLKSGVNGATKQSDYRCYNGQTDGFNFQSAGNYDSLPIERTGAFVLGSYKLSDSIEAYAELLHHKLRAHTQLAPLPFDLEQNNLTVPSDQYYNPFGTAFGTDGASNDLLLRTTPLGDRGFILATTTDLVNIGARGAIADSSWNWDGHISYGKLTTQTQLLGFLDISKIAADFACTTAPGAGDCTPINIFNLSDPTTQAIFREAAISPFLKKLYQEKRAELQANGTLFSLPAGDVQLALGADYRKEYLHSAVDPLINTTFTNDKGLVTLNCAGPGSICTSPTQGGFSVKEGYAELLLPVLKDLPFVHSLNIDLGDRWSKYSNFGTTNNWKAALEWRPIEDLLLRGTVSKVFRAPTPTDLFAGPTADSPTATDPCAGNPGAKANPACQGYSVPPQLTSQPNGYVMGSQFANEHLGTNSVLEPEHGKSFSYGAVYDPAWIPGMSLNADYFRFMLNSLIVSGAGIAQTVLTQCFNTGGAVCSNIFRNTDGSIRYIVESPFNSGNLSEDGFDVGMHYRLPQTPFGNFRIGLDASYIDKWNVSQGGFTQHLAGHYDKTFGNFSRLRAVGALNWDMGAFNAQWKSRYIGPLTLGYANQCIGPSAAAGDSAVGCDNYKGYATGHSILHYGAVTYHDLTFGYNVEALNLALQLGIDNLFDRQPPILYQNNVLNANTDVATYDTVGRFFHASATLKF
ncbi:MAG TPA: TonB-dependent receptor [Rudaea sp.]